MTPLLRPVTKMKCSMPASLASSTTYWISGLSTMVSISLGIALVAGSTRVPRPATGKTALRIFMAFSLGVTFGRLLWTFSGRFLRALWARRKPDRRDRRWWGLGSRFAAPNKGGFLVAVGC